MQMSAEEIVRHYQQAKNKSADIGVLADLNSTDKASIRAVLADAGVLKPDPPVHGRSQSQSTESRAALARAIAEGLDQQLPAKEIAQRVGCTPETVHNHIKRRAQATAPTTKAAAPTGHTAGLADKGNSTYASVEAILSALPAGADEDTRVCAFDLCMRLLRGALLTRLGVDR